MSDGERRKVFDGIRRGVGYGRRGEVNDEILLPSRRQGGIGTETRVLDENGRRGGGRRRDGRRGVGGDPRGTDQTG